MSVSPVISFPPSTEPQAEQATVRLAQTPEPVSGNGSTQESDGPQVHASHVNLSQDEVKVQMEPPGEIAVYQFLNQYGTLVLQVPPQQLLNLAQEISQQLAQESAPKPAPQVEKGDSNVH